MSRRHADTGDTPLVPPPSWRRDDEPADDGCRRRVVLDGDHTRCGHGYGAHDRRIPGGPRDACSLCDCPGYHPDFRPAFLVLGVLILVVTALVLIFGAF
ncbi:hypothetical protein GCM10023201_41420 [Actinomycetospora corticicola]|uniref:Uncharacterized protein n=1 Tax=Actinomycetospora corticicola TaxID=663602 RepID=A0A7Y9DWG4_9PSEU|nr:hypothetical protein [Actinomycetospora corticicola]NYD36770.1 hypothetical protein [Actinomycetospora corticicola]